MKSVWAFLVVAILSALWGIGTVFAADEGPSFACKMAKTAAEHLICNGRGLSRLDRDLAQTFRAELAKLSGRDRDALTANQRAWLRQRDEDCSEARLSSAPRLFNPSAGDFEDAPDPESCLIDALNDRIEALKSYSPQIRFTPHRTQKFADGLSLPDFPATRQPFTPSLIVDKSDVCSDFLASVRLNFFSAQPWQRSYQLFDPDTDIQGMTALSVSDGQAVYLVHLDGINKEQTLAVSSHPTTFLSGEAEVWVKPKRPTEGEIAEFSHGMFLRDQKKSAAEGWVRAYEVSGFDGVSASLFLRGNQVFVLRDSSKREWGDELPANAVGLYRITATGELDPTCVALAAPFQSEAATKFARKVPIRKGGAKGGRRMELSSSERYASIFDAAGAPESVRTLYGAFDKFIGSPASEDARCVGMHGNYSWGVLRRRQQFFVYASFARPWDLTTTKAFGTETKLATFPGWGFSYLRYWSELGPDNYLVYKRILELLPPATDALASYYADRFGLTEEAARRSAVLAIDEVVNASLQLDGRAVPTTDRRDDPTFLVREDFESYYAKPSSLPIAAITGAVSLGLTDLLTGLPDGAFDDPQILLYGLGSADMTKFLLRKHALVEAKNYFGKTALMYSVQAGNFSVAKTLLDAHVDVNAATVSSDDPCNDWPKISGRTALMYAAENASAPLVEALVIAGADVDARDSEGGTAFNYFSANTKVVGTDRDRIEALLMGAAPAK